ncbi:uridine phosphorylase [Psychromonas sp. RZ22]|uniref:uridine phosphorylase n=1 Tax=Psychromonas algarum TaxID=2555643 RepID=UPI001068267D|nr:uridine phosphorylase [Psychromonas sp. RZ22]TEW53711.1 uridine phosphorylase [Psychromonas sp. RZ22]
MSDVFHLGLTKSALQGAAIAIIPGAPERVEKIAALMENATFLARHREFTSYLAFIGEQAVVICSTGIGGPSVSIAVEELAQLGVRSFLRVGTTGAIQPHVNVGDIIITQAAVRLDGASLHFAPMEFPAASDFYATSALNEACLQKNITPHIGITASSDTFYPGQERYDTVAGRVTPHFKNSLQKWQELGVLNYEMEASTLFTMCSANGWQAACVAGVIVNRTQQEIPEQKTMEQTENNAIMIAVDAVKLLLKK